MSGFCGVAYERRCALPRNQRYGLSSRTVAAETELTQLMTLCRKFRLSATKIRKVKRMIRILYDPDV